MIYIAVEHKVIEGLAASVARASGMTEDAALAGMVRMWHRCWVGKTDTMTGDEIAGQFAFNVSSSDGSARAIAALVAFGFLETKTDSTWRVRGVSRYLRVKESRVLGAKITNAKKHAQKTKALALRASQDTLLERPGAYAQARSSPNVRMSEEKDLSISSGELPDAKPRKQSAQQEFFAWSQASAKESNPAFLASASPKPALLNAQLKTYIETIGRQGLESAWGEYKKDQYAIAQGLPWGLFVSKISELHNKSKARPQQTKSRVVTVGEDIYATPGDQA